MKTGPSLDWDPASSQGSVDGDLPKTSGHAGHWEAWLGASWILLCESVSQTRNVCWRWVMNMWGVCDILYFYTFGVFHNKKCNCFPILYASLVAQIVKNLLAMQEMQVWSLGREGPLEKGTATHSNILAWRIPWTEEPNRLQSMGVTKSWKWLCD